jgi:hypothetical protein
VSLRDVVWYNMTNRLLSSDHVLLWHLEAVIEIGRERSCFALSCDEEENMRAKHGGEEGGRVRLRHTPSHTFHFPLPVSPVRRMQACVCTRHDQGTANGCKRSGHGMTAG